MKSVKAFAWLVLIGTPLLLSFSYVREALLVDSCLDGGGSFDYLRMMCDREVNHAFIPYSERHGRLLGAALPAMFVAAAYLSISRGKARSG